MKRILIADASKASLVMTSEVFKDHFPGVQVVVARNSADAIELAKSAGELDAFIIDYDLPDRDGAYTAARLKKMFSQPILITAFDRPDVQQSIDRDLSAFDDCLSWLKKPVKPELVVLQHSSIS
jgi:CheY-like chemotaxis protein